MAEKLKVISDARHISEESQCSGRDVRQEAQCFKFLWPRHCVSSSCYSAPLNLQGSGESDVKNNGAVSPMTKISKSAGAITLGADSSMYRDANMSNPKVQEISIAPRRETSHTRKCMYRRNLNFVNANLMPFTDKESTSALGLHSSREIFPFHPGKILKKRKKSSLFDTKGSTPNKYLFQEEKMESGTSAYARRETGENERLLKEITCQGRQLQQFVVMQSRGTGSKAGIHTAKKSTYSNMAAESCVGESANVAGPIYAGKLNKRTFSCTDMKSDYSFLSGVIEEQSVMSDPCHSMPWQSVQCHIRQRYTEETSMRRGSDKFSENRYVNASSSGFYMEPMSAGGSLSLPSNPEILTDNCKTEIFNLARSYGHYHESMTNEKSFCDSQRILRFTYIDSQDQTLLRPSKCSGVEKNSVSKSNNHGINTLEESCELQEKTHPSNSVKTSGSTKVENKSAASIQPNVGSSGGTAHKGFSSHEPEKIVNVGESKTENCVSIHITMEQGCTINNERESVVMDKGKKPSFGNAFLQDGVVHKSNAYGLREEDLLCHPCGDDLLCHMKPKILDDEEMTPTSEASEPSSRWVKRLQLCSVDSFALGTNSFNFDSSSNSGQVQKLFTRVLNYSRSHSNIQLTKDTEQKKTSKSMTFSVENRDSPVESLKRSYPWIRRWCRTSQEHVRPKLVSEDLLFSRRDTQVPCQQGLDEAKQFPSIGAMAMMGKAVTNFRSCEFKRRGPFIIWNTDGTLQE